MGDTTGNQRHGASGSAHHTHADDGPVGDTGRAPASGRSGVDPATDRALADRGFTIRRVLARDGSGLLLVARAHDTDVVVKLAHRGDPLGAGQIRREAEVMRAIGDRPGVLGLLGSGDLPDDAGDRPYLVLPLAVRSLQEAMNLAPLSWPEALTVLQGAAVGLQAVHDEGFLHCDVSPANVLVDWDGRGLIADLGVAARAGTGQAPARQTVVGDRVVATLGYVAPEILSGDAFSTASDTYGLAATIVAALEGTSATIGSRPSLRLVPRRHRAAFAAALHPDPRARTGSPAAFLAAVEGPVRRRSGALRSGLWVASAVAVAAAAVAGVVALGAAGDTTTDDGATTTAPTTAPPTTVGTTTAAPTTVPPTIVSVPPPGARAAGALVGFGEVCTDPLPLPSVTDAVDVDMGDCTVLALRADGSLAMASKEPSLVQGTPTGRGFTAVAVGSKHALAVRDGAVICWGLSPNGECDVPVGALSDVVLVEAATTHSVALKADGTVLAWGDAKDATGATEVPAGLRAVWIGVGARHTTAVRPDGRPVAWGAREDVESRVGEDRGQQRAPDRSDVTMTDGGGYHTVAALADGTVLGWGSDDSGQLEPPADVADVAIVVAGGHHSLAISRDGRVWCWGARQPEGLTTVFDRGQCAVPPGVQGRVIAADAGGWATVLVVGNA
jgi:hypothetical protein